MKDRLKDYIIFVYDEIREVIIEREKVTQTQLMYSLRKGWPVFPILEKNLFDKITYQVQITTQRNSNGNEM
jgi:hypothetical protein